MRTPATIVGMEEFGTSAIRIFFGQNNLRTIVASNHPERASGMFDADAESVGVDDRDWALRGIDGIEERNDGTLQRREGSHMLSGDVAERADFDSDSVPL